MAQSPSVQQKTYTLAEQLFYYSLADTIQEASSQHGECWLSSDDVVFSQEARPASAEFIDQTLFRAAQFFRNEGLVLEETAQGIKLAPEEFFWRKAQILLSQYAERVQTGVYDNVLHELEEQILMALFRFQLAYGNSVHTSERDENREILYSLLRPAFADRSNQEAQFLKSPLQQELRSQIERFGERVIDVLVQSVKDGQRSKLDVPAFEIPPKLQQLFAAMPSLYRYLQGNFHYIVNDRDASFAQQGAALGLFSPALFPSFNNDFGSNDDAFMARLLYQAGQYQEAADFSRKWNSSTSKFFSEMARRAQAGFPVLRTVAQYSDAGVKYVPAIDVVARFVKDPFQGKWEAIKNFPLVAELSTESIRGLPFDQQERAKILLYALQTDKSSLPAELRLLMDVENIPSDRLNEVKAAVQNGESIRALAPSVAKELGFLPAHLDDTLLVIGYLPGDKKRSHVRTGENKIFFDSEEGVPSQGTIAHEFTHIATPNLCQLPDTGPFFAEGYAMWIERNVMRNNFDPGFQFHNQRIRSSDIEEHFYRPEEAQRQEIEKENKHYLVGLRAVELIEQAIGAEKVKELFRDIEVLSKDALEEQAEALFVKHTGKASREWVERATESFEPDAFSTVSFKYHFGNLRHSGLTLESNLGNTGILHHKIAADVLFVDHDELGNDLRARGKAYEVTSESHYALGYALEFPALMDLDGGDFFLFGAGISLDYISDGKGERLGALSSIGLDLVQVPLWNHWMISSGAKVYGVVPEFDALDLMYTATFGVTYQFH